MFECEYCNKEFKNSRALSGHKGRCIIRRSKLNLPKLDCNLIKSNKRSGNGDWKCPECDLILDTRRKLYTHRVDFHNYLKTSHVINKGLTKETSESVAKATETYKKNLKDGKFTHPMLGKNLSESHKKAVSNGMKKAHAEGRAWNIGRSRWNNEPSFPERFFMDVIANEFDDKNYIHEHPFHNYSLDFAWIDKKLCIEVDGEQHQRFQYQIDSDKRKDSLLTSEGWKVLRINWKDCFNDPKKYIKIAKDFIGSI